MSVSPQHRISSSDRTRFLEMAGKVIDHADIVHLLEPAKAATSSSTAGANQGSRGRGRPPVRPQLAARPLLLVMFELVWSGSVVSWAAVAERLWFVYSKKELKLIGLPKNWRDEKLATKMRLSGKEKSTRKKRARAAKRWHAEVKRITAIADRIFATIDDTALPANRVHSAAAIDAALKARPELVALTAAKNHVMNRLGVAALIYFNQQNHPELADPADLHAGILRHHRFDLGVDEHVAAVAHLKYADGERQHDKGGKTAASDREDAVAATTPGNAGSSRRSPNRRSSAKQDSGGGKTRRHGVAEAIGITAVQAIARPTGHRVPNVILGFGLGTPSAASVHGTMTALDAVDQNTTRTPPTGKARQYVIADMGYTTADHMNARLIDRGYSLVGQYAGRSGRARAVGPGPNVPADETGAPVLFNGVVLCPAAASLASKLTTFKHPETERMSSKQKAEHDKVAQLLKRYIMPTDGRIESATRAGRGRPRVGEEPLVDNYRLPVICPAEEGKLRCPLVPSSFAALGPEVPISDDPPLEEPRPHCCTKKFSSIHLDSSTVKWWQEHMVGSWEHADLLSLGRTRTEAPFSQLTRRGGGNLNFGTIAFHKRGAVAIVIGLAIAATNIHTMQQWESVLDTNGGEPPRESGEIKKRQRQAEICRTNGTK